MLDRIYRINWIFVFISFLMKEIKVNPLCGITIMIFDYLEYKILEPLLGKLVYFRHQEILYSRFLQETVKKSCPSCKSCLKFF